MSASRPIRLSALDTKTKISGLLAMMVIAVNVVGIAMSLFLYFSLHGILDRRSGVNLIKQINSDYAKFEKIDSSTRVGMAEVRDLNSSLDLHETQQNIPDTAELLFEKERDYQVFYRLLKVNIYYLVSQIQGTGSWYEMYSPEIDEAIERSKSRQMQLLQIRQYYELLEDSV